MGLFSDFFLRTKNKVDPSLDNQLVKRGMFSKRRELQKGVKQANKSLFSRTVNEFRNELTPQVTTKEEIIKQGLFPIPNGKGGIVGAFDPTGFAGVTKSAGRTAGKAVAREVAGIADREYVQELVKKINQYVRRTPDIAERGDFIDLVGRLMRNPETKDIKIAETLIDEIERVLFTK